MELIGKANLSFVPAAAIAVGVVRRADYLQSRLGKRPFGPKRLPRLHLDCAECLFFAIAAGHEGKEQLGECREPPLQQFCGDVGQGRALAFAEEDVLKEGLAFHLLAQVGEAVGPLVQVGLVNLEDIAGEHHLGALSGAGDDGFYLVRGEVLGLVHNKVHLAQGAAADIGQRGN